MTARTGAMTTDASRLKRPQYPMPDFVSQALAARGLEQAYRDRPAYQQNDYIGWITRAKRLAQMLDELAAGGIYMNMKHAASAKP